MANSPKNKRFWYRAGLGCGIVLFIHAVVIVDIAWVIITLIGIVKCWHELRER